MVSVFVFDILNNNYKVDTWKEEFCNLKFKKMKNKNVMS